MYCPFFSYLTYIVAIVVMLTMDLTPTTKDKSDSASSGHCQEVDPKLRILAAIPLSDSTLCMRIFLEAPECAVTSRLVLMGNYGSEGAFCPDYTIFHNPESLAVYQEAKASRKSILISKEELGHECWKGECDYRIFPDEASIERTLPVFLFRDPLRVFDSWKAVGWSDVGSLLIAYRNLYNTWLACKQAAIAITYEELIAHPDQTVKRLCRHWGVNFSHNLLFFQHPFGGFLFSSERERRIYSVDNPLGLFDTVQSNQTIVADIKSHGLPTMEEKARIEQDLGGMYISAYGDRIQDVKDALMQKTHFGFDLDDTLHEFRKASGAATASVIQHLAGLNSLTCEELHATYVKILAQATSGAFSDGRTSEDYRKERFVALLESHDIEVSNKVLEHLLRLYKSSLQVALTLKSGAMELLSKLQRMDKQVVLVTEGPEDAQRWTLENLGIADKVDVLVTSNKFGKTKTDGLFRVALKALGIEARDFVFVGDNLARDIVPAEHEGIMTVHYSESENVRLEVKGMRVNSLWKLEELLETLHFHAEDRDVGSV